MRVFQCEGFAAHGMLNDHMITSDHNPAKTYSGDILNLEDVKSIGVVDVHFHI